jgi:hypothetical protein
LRRKEWWEEYAPVTAQSQQLQVEGEVQGLAEDQEFFRG